MKLIKINEAQKSRLFEAYQEGFSFKNLTMMADTAFAMGQDESDGQMRYCTHWLGFPTSMGSSRAVYTLTDNFVLKLAYGRQYKAGIAQNRVEFETYHKLDTPLLPKILYHDKNFTYLVCENVVPAAYTDFEKILGIPFNNTYYQHTIKTPNMWSPNNGDISIGFDKYFDNLKPYKQSNEKINMGNIMTYIEYNFALDEPYRDVEVEEVIMKTPWLNDLVELVEKTKMTDLMSISNYGMVNRDGKPMIVILDSGFNEDVYQKYYR